MPRPVPLPVRQKLFERHQRGESVADLAEAFGLPARTVRGLCQRFRTDGPDGVAPRYAAPSGAAAGTPEEWRAVALQMRHDHPTWGAGLIRVLLRDQCPDRTWPSERAIQRWLKAAGLAPAPPGRSPGGSVSRATTTHHTWQVDAAEAMDLADGSGVSWLRVVDEFSGAVLRTTVFPPAAVAAGGRGGGAGRPAAGVRPLGAAGPHSGGQRPPVGVG